MTVASTALTAALTETRQRTLSLVRELPDAALETVHSTLLSPLVWDLGHIAAFEDLWIHRSFGTPMLEVELIGVYDADETPRAGRGQLPFLHREAALDYLARTRSNTLAVLDAAGEDPRPERLELIIRHELQHGETMCQTLQIAGLDCGLEAQLRPPSACRGDGLELIDVPAASVRIGAAGAPGSGEGFAYDNERPRRRVELAPFRIAASPVSNRAWAEFIAAGGYTRRDLWSDAGWAWRTAEDVHAPLYWDGHGTARTFSRRAEPAPDQPVCHVSAHEADAFAAFTGLRLPTEFEWEAAADRIDGAADSVWQWTASEFDRYPGFVADPYPEYSEQFFGRGYRVLRGGAWLSSPRVTTATFRNWDLPERRQIFSGLRLAADA